MASLREGDAAMATALLDGPAEKAPGAGGDEERRNIRAPGRLPEDRDLLRIAPKGVDAGLHPAQRCHEIEGAIVPGAVLRAFSPKGSMMEPAQGAQTIVQGDHHHGLRLRKLRAIVKARVARAIAPAVDPYHDREGVFGLGASRGVDVQKETVFVAPDLPHHVVRRAAEGGGDLRTGGAKGEGFATAFPGPGCPGGAPAQIPGGRCGVGKAAPHLGARGRNKTDEFPLGQLADRARLRAGRWRLRGRATGVEKGKQGKGE